MPQVEDRSLPPGPPRAITIEGSWGVEASFPRTNNKPMPYKQTPEKGIPNLTADGQNPA